MYSFKSSRTDGRMVNPLRSRIQSVAWSRHVGFPFVAKEITMTSYLQLIIFHIRGLWFNPPRRRRYLMKSLLEWHALYDHFVNMTCQVDVQVRFCCPRFCLLD